MRKTAFLLLISIILFSCRKDAAVPEAVNNGGTGTSVVPFVPLTVGSFWVYQYLIIDTLGNETITNVDTMRITKDSIINGKSYAFIKGSYQIYCPMCYSFRRDSSGYLVCERGTIFFSSTNFKDTLHVFNSPGIFVYYKMTHKDSSVTVPSGIFPTSDYQGSYYFPPSYPYDNPRQDGTLYSYGVGIVKNYDFYGYSKYTIESRLVSYYIAP